MDIGKTSRKRLLKPVSFTWPNNPEPVQLTAPATRRESAALANARATNLVEQLNYYAFTWNGMTFSFVARVDNPKNGVLNVGVRVLKDENLAPLSPWYTPWQNRRGVRKRILLNGQDVFGPMDRDREKNCFSTAAHEGLGWMMLAAYGDKPELFILGVQDDIYFFDEVERQWGFSSAHRAKLKKLRYWKHLLAGALENLAPRLSYGSIAVLTREDRYKHMYDGTFPKRVDDNRKTPDNPKGKLYHRVEFSDLPGREAFCDWSRYWWINQFNAR